MKLVHHLLQAFVGNVSVDLRGGDVGVSEQRLHHAQICAVVHQMRGEGVAQIVWRNMRHAHLLGVARNHHPSQLAADACFFFAATRANSAAK